MTGIMEIGRNRQNVFKWMGQITVLRKEAKTSSTGFGGQRGGLAMSKTGKLI